MDPITLIIFLIILTALTGGGIYTRQENRKREELLLMKDAIRSRGVGHVHTQACIFDVFWDLGASEFALELMANQRFLPNSIQELPLALDQINDAITEQGSYDTFIRENLEAIEEMYQEHRRTGNRRALPLLEQRQHKTLELPAITDSQTQSTPGTDMVLAPGTGLIRPGERRQSAMPMLDLGGVGLEVDIDALVRVDPVAILKSVFFGESEEVARWWNMRTLRGLRDTLNADLRLLYEAYVFEASRNPDFYRHLYDVAERWDVEARRLDAMQRSQSFKGRRFEVCAHALVMEATAVARKLSNHARFNVDQTIELIHSHARKGDTSMAGYLIFLNRHAFFAGRLAKISHLIQRIENTTYKMQSELRTLTRQ